MFAILFRGHRLNHVANQIGEVVGPKALRCVRASIRPEANALRLENLIHVACVSGIAPAKGRGCPTLGIQDAVPVEKLRRRGYVLADGHLMGTNQFG